MKCILPLMLVLSIGATAYGCKDKSDDDKKPGNPNGPERPGGPGSSGNPGAPTPEEINTNPVERIEPPTAVLEAGAFTDGPVWHAGMGVLFFSTPLGDGALYRMLPDGRVLKIRDGVAAQGTQPIGNTVNAGGDIITVEAKRIVRTAAAGGDPTVIATSYAGGPPVPGPPAGPDAGAGPPPATPGQFDTLNDVVARKDGTLYVTDPGYFVMPEPQANRIYRIDPSGNVQVVEAFEDVPRPNGIALSPDEKTLYVGFTAPMQGTVPFVRKYIVNDDGTLGEWTKFVDIGPENSSPDGLAVDKVGNLYVATRAGVQVYKSDGKPWGTIEVPEKPTGLSFGGEDMKTLYITSEGTKIWQVKTKLAGIAQ
jgi:gluconolactonase